VVSNYVGINFPSQDFSGGGHCTRGSSPVYHSAKFCSRSHKKCPADRSRDCPAPGKRRRREKAGLEKTRKNKLYTPGAVHKKKNLYTGFSEDEQLEKSLLRSQSRKEPKLLAGEPQLVPVFEVTAPAQGQTKVIIQGDGRSSVG
jgi:hypothetical protein